MANRRLKTKRIGGASKEALARAWRYRGYKIISIKVISRANKNSAGIYKITYR